CRDPDAGELAETSVDSVGGVAGRDESVYDGAGSVHPFDRVRRKGDFLVVGDDCVHLFECKIVSGESDGHWALLSVAWADFIPKTERYFSGKSFGLPFLPQMTWVVSPEASSVWSASRQIS